MIAFSKHIFRAAVIAPLAIALATAASAQAPYPNRNITLVLPFAAGALDLVVCRNVTIYFARETTRALVDRFHDALRPGGYLVLGHAARHHELSANLGNIALLGIAAELGLIPEAAAAATADAYREYRRLQHAKRLSANPQTRIDRDSLGRHIAAVSELWKRIFDA